jgi:crossover junction endodeoxyribonuclease RuvC
MQKLSRSPKGWIYLAPEQETTRVLGIDPGTATVGYGVLECGRREQFKALASGIIQTSKDMPAGNRLGIIRADIISLIVEYAPDVLAIESIFFAKNAKTLVPVAQARGVIIEAAASMRIPVSEYAPGQVKLIVSGHGRAEKLYMQQSVARLLNHTDIIKPDDASDALAIAICHARLTNVSIPPLHVQR